MGICLLVNQIVKSSSAMYKFLPLLALTWLMTTHPVFASSHVNTCQGWFDPQSQQQTTAAPLLDRALDAPIVLLGEHHDNPQHHLFQLQTLAQLHARHPHMVIGFEMFPRSVQPILDQWVAGDFDESGFLTAVDWDGVWGIAADYYMPLFQFARLNHIPMLALNVERSLVRHVARQGWDSLSDNQKNGLKKPYPAPTAYRESLKHAFQHHGGDADDPENKEKFDNFVAAQLTWDGAMAQALHARLKTTPNALIVAIVGSGHLTYGHGIPHQLAQAGVSSKSLIPYSYDADCPSLDPTLADGVFLIKDSKQK